MTAELTHPTLDAAHAVLVAAWDATRFYTDPELGGLVGRLRRTAAAANEATLRGCKGLAEAGGRRDELRARRAQLIGAGALLRELADGVEAARRRGLDLAAATELLEYQTHASVTLAELVGHLREEESSRAA